MSLNKIPEPAAGAACQQAAVDAARRFLDQQVTVAARARREANRLPTHDLDAFLHAAEPLRAELSRLLALSRLPAPQTTPLTRRPAAPGLEALRWEPWPGFASDGLAARLNAAPRPTVLLLHSLTGSPEAVLGPHAPGPLAALARALVNAGCQVVVPRWVSDWRERQRLARQARLLGLEWLGLELTVLRRLVDALTADGSVDADRLGVYGFSRGGQLALLLAATDPRPCATAVGSWFCHRVAKLLETGDPRLVSYLDSPEDEQFVPGWLAAFNDGDLATLAAPEPLLVTHGLDDPVTPYEHVEAAFGPVAELYEALGFGELARLHLQPGGHAPAVAATLAFFRQWLGLAALVAPAPEPAVPNPRPRVSQPMAARRRRARRRRWPDETSWRGSSPLPCWLAATGRRRRRHSRLRHRRPKPAATCATRTSGSSRSADGT